MERVRDLSWDRDLTQSVPSKLKPEAQVEQIVAEMQSAHLAGQAWHDPVELRNLPEPQVLLEETHMF
jgi:hypothetical protein